MNLLGRRWAAVASILSAVAILSACGTTLPASRWTAVEGGNGLSATTGSGGDGSLGSAGGGASSGLINAGNGVVLSSGGQATPSGNGQSASGSASGSGSDGLSGAGPASSSSQTSSSASGSNEPIKVGVATYEDAGAASSLGFQDVPAVNAEQVYNGLIDYYNAHGGFGGHRVEPIYYEYPIVTSASESSLDQAACATFTQDNHVAVVLADRPEYDGDLLTCLAKAGIPMIYDFIGYLDQRLEQTYAPLLYMPDQRIGQEVVSAWIDGLQAEDYFAPWPSAGPAWPSGSRIGLVTVDDPGYLRIASAIGPALARYGLKLTDTAEIDIGDVSSEETDVDNSVLKFRADHIDHVLIMDSPPQLTILWPTAAQSQSYFPRFGLNSYNTLSFAADNVPSKEFDGALGIGWMPYEDVQSAQPNQAASQCLAIATQAGVNTSAYVNQGIVTWICAIVLLYKDAMDRSSPSNPAAVGSYIQELGTSWESPFTFGTSFGPDRHDGAAYYRDVGFNSSCGCFQYTSSTLHPF